MAETQTESNPPAGDGPGANPAVPPAPPPAMPETPGPVPYDRFREVNDRAKTLEVRLAKIEADRKAAAEKAAAEQGQWQQLAETREKELQAERLTNTRQRVAMQKGIPADLVARLQGEDEGAIAADADKLLAFLKPATGPGVPPPSRNGQPARVDMSNMSPEQVRKSWKPS